MKETSLINYTLQYTPAQTTVWVDHPGVPCKLVATFYSLWEAQEYLLMKEMVQKIDSRPKFNTLREKDEPVLNERTKLRTIALPSLPWPKTIEGHNEDNI